MKPIRATLIFMLAGSLLFTACGGPDAVTEVPPTPMDTLAAAEVLEVTDTLAPTETLVPTSTFTPDPTRTKEPTPTLIVAKTVVRNCNAVGAYSFEIPKTNYRFKEEGDLTQAYRFDDYVAVKVERKTNEAQDSLNEIMDNELAVIEIDMREYMLGEVTELALLAGDALTVDFSGSLLVDESIVGQVTVIMLEDGNYLSLIGFGKFDGPNDMWDQEGRQMYNHILESLEVYPKNQGVDVCPTPESPT